MIISEVQIQNYFFTLLSSASDTDSKALLPQRSIKGFILQIWGRQARKCNDLLKSMLKDVSKQVRQDRKIHSITSLSSSYSGTPESSSLP